MQPVALDERGNVFVGDCRRGQPLDEPFDGLVVFEAVLHLKAHELPGVGAGTDVMRCAGVFGVVVFVSLASRNNLVDQFDFAPQENGFSSATRCRVKSWGHSQLPAYPSVGAFSLLVCESFLALLPANCHGF
jgi:hypothetical protein